MRILLPILMVALTACVFGGAPPPFIPPQTTSSDIVRGDQFDTLIIEIDFVTGHGPDEEALDLLQGELDELVASGHIDKPGGITFVIDDELPANADPEHPYTFEEQREISNSARDLELEPGQVSIHMLYLDGERDDDQGGSTVTLGYAYGGSFIAMLKNNIDSACDRSPALALLAPQVAEQICEITEAGVLAHEIGHLLGLVNNGTPMVNDHQDTEHGAHDIDEDCLMHFLADTADAVDVVAGRFGSGDDGVPKLDAACLADLEAEVNR